MKTRQGVTIILLLTLIGGTLIQASIPPHPRLRELIARGEVTQPYFLRQTDEIRARGVNRPWSAPLLTDRLRVEGIAPSRAVGAAVPPSGDYKALLILVDFSDHTAQTDAAYFDTLAFYQGAGTLWDYFQDVSYGTLDIVTLNDPGSIGWVRAPQTYSYYEAGQNGTGSYPQNSQRLVLDVVRAVDGSVDFSQYDNDGDNIVDALFIVHAGTGAEYAGGSNIWSHAWAVPSDTVMDDGGIVRHYSIEPEFWAGPGDMTIGVFAHEMGHAVFGLPDLYDYGIGGTGTASRGLGRWSLMAGGSWNGIDGDSPALPDAWSHVQMGYINPMDKPANEIGYMVAPVADSAEVHRVWINGVSGDEYFLVENRQLLGYDAALPDEGLLIYHIDEALIDAVYANDNEWYPGYEDYGHYLVALEQADGLWNLERNENSGDLGDPYPGSTANTSFDHFTTPDSRTYAGGGSGITLANIDTSGDFMLVDFMVEPPSIAITPDSLFADLVIGDSSVQTLTIDNSNGGGDLFYEIVLDNIGLGSFTFTKQDYADPTDPASQDRITSNVWITRDTTQGIYNAATESYFYSANSPEGTEWSFGNTADLEPDDYQVWVDAVSWLPLSMINAPMSVHLTTDDLYFDILFHSWTSGGNGGGFSYTRTDLRPAWLRVSTVSDTVPTGQIQDITVAFVTQGMLAGSYDGAILVSSNDPVTPQVRIPVHLELSGVPNIIVSTDTLDFGSAFVGYSSTDTLLISNDGTDVLSVTGISADAGSYSASPSVFDLAPGESQAVGIVFDPTAIGSYPATLTITSNDTTETVALLGEAVNPPVIAVTPDHFVADQVPGDTSIQNLNIDNSAGGSDLIWQSYILHADTAVVVEASPVFEGVEGPEPDKSSDGVAEPTAGTGAIYRASSSMPQLASKPVSSPSPSDSPFRSVYQPGLGDVLADLDANIQPVIDAIPARYPFTHGVTGNYISDGGNDMYDAGNYLSTDLGGYITYSDGIIATSSYLGAGGSYFTRKYDGLFVFTANVDGVSYFEISGGLGADGYGNVDGSVLALSKGGATYYGFVKRVYNTSDPSVNHLIIVSDNASATHEFDTNSNVDYHRVTGLASTDRFYYLLYAGASGYYIDDAATLAIMDAFLETLDLSPPWISLRSYEGTIAGGASEDVDVLITPEGIISGDFYAQIMVASNDPANQLVMVPAELHFTGAPEIAVEPDTLDFGTLYIGDDASQQIVIENNGTDLLSVTDISTTFGEYTLDPTAFDLIPGESQVVTVSFAPLAVGNYDAVLTILNNDTTVTVTLLATATTPPEIVVSPGQIDEDLVAGTVSEPQLIIIENTGGYGLEYSVTLEAPPAAVESINQVPTISSWLSVNPTSGVVTPGGSDTLEVVFDATSLYAGDYGAVIAIVSNDPLTPDTSVVALLAVTGDPEIAVVPATVVFDSVFANASAVSSLEVQNTGTDVLEVLDMVASSPVFVIDTSAFAVDPGTSRMVEFTFTPTEVQAYDDSVTITSNDTTVVVQLVGVGTPPPVIAVSPDSLWDALFVGDTSDTYDLIIDNSAGGAELTYQVRVEDMATPEETAATISYRPAAARVIDQVVPDQLLSSEVRSGDDMEYSPKLTTNDDIGGPLSRSAATSGIQVAIVQGSFWTANLYNYLTGLPDISVDLISSYSLTTLQNYDVVIHYGNTYINYAVLNAYVEGGGGLIATPWVLWFGELDALPATGGTVADHHEPLNVQVTDPSDPLIRNVSFINGDQVGYEGGVALKEGAECGVFWADGSPAASYWQYGDGVGIYLDLHYITSDCSIAIQYGWGQQLIENAIKIAAGYSTVPWIRLSENSGSVAPGSTDTVSFYFDARNIYGGSYNAAIAIANNDPLNPEVRVGTHLDVTGYPGIALQPDTLVFDSLFVGQMDSLDLTIINDGSDLLTVSGFSSPNPAFTLGRSLPFSIPPADSLKIPVHYTPSVVGTNTATITITSDATDELTTTFVARGTGLEPPVMVLSAESFSASIAVGDTDRQVLTIENQGLGTLEFQISFKDTSQEATSQASREDNSIASPGVLASPSEGASRYAYTVDDDYDAVLVIDTETNEVVEEIAVGAFPHRLEFNADGSEVWVSDYSYSKLFVINTATNTVIHEIPLEGDPFDLAFSPDGRWAYVAARGYGYQSPPAVEPEAALALPSDGMYIIDAETHTVVDSIAGMDGAKDIAVSPNGRYGYLLTHNGTVYVIELNARTIVDTITGASGGHTIKLSRDGRRVYFSEGHFNSPSAMRYIDLATNTLSGPIGSFNGSVGFDFSPDGTLLYALDGWGEQVVVISTVTDEVVGTIPNGNLGEAFGLAISRDGRYGYVTSPWSDDGNNLFIFETETNSFIAALEPNRELRDIEVFHRGTVTWVRADPTFASVPPQSSLDVAVLFDARTVEGGSYDAHMIVASNDPQKPETWLPVHLDAEGVPNIAVEPDTLDFGTVWAFWPARMQLDVSNVGSDLLDITGITANNTAYLVDPANFQLQPRESRVVEVVLLPDTPGIYDATLTLTSNDPDEPEVLVTLNGEAMEPPVMVVNPGEFSMTLEPGDSTSFELELRNEGGTALNVDLRKGSGGNIEAMRQRHAAKLVISNRESAPSAVAPGDRGGSRYGVPEGESPAAVAASPIPVGTGEADTGWTPVASLNEARGQNGLLAMPDGLIYAFGGYAGGSPSSSMEIYDPGSDAWTYGISMPSTERGHSFAPGLDGRFYSFAWFTTNSYAYDPLTSTWTTITSPPLGGVWEGGAALGSDGLIYLLGGEDMGGAVQIYNPASDSWTQGTSMPTARQQLGVVAGPGGYIYAIGGRSDTDTYIHGTVEVYEPATDSWSTASPMPTPRNQFAVCLGPDDRIYIIGGKDNYSNNSGPFFDVVEIYDPFTDTWETGPPLPVPLGEMEAVAMDGYIYVVGGTNGTFSAEVYVLDVAAANWLTLSGTSFAIPPNGTETVTVDLKSAGLETGRYSAAVVLNSNDPGMSTYDILVDMILSPLGPPQVSAVVDVPNDQGGKATVTWLASEDDAAGSAAPIAFYRVWLRAPEGYVNPVLSPVSNGPISTSTTPDLMLADGWATFLDSIPAQQAADYTVTIPTFADSNQTGTHWTSVTISAHVAEDSVFYALSEAGRGYSVDNLAPSTPSGIVATVTDSVVLVDWTWTPGVDDGDFWHFRLFRSQGPIFSPGPEDIPIAITDSLSYTDADVVDWTYYYYRVAAVDTNGNMALSNVSAGVTLDVLADLGIPDQFQLHQNYPNPFNPTTTLKFEVPVAGRVRLAIYDLLGREVNRLVDGNLEPGYFEIRWDGRNANGVPLATGLYFARMVAPEYVKTVKMIMMK